MKKIALFLFLVFAVFSNGQSVLTHDIGDTLIISVVTGDTTVGANVDADAAPTFRIYENITETPIETGTIDLCDDANTTGFYSDTSELTTAKGYEPGKTYIILKTAVIGGKSFSEIMYLQIRSRMKITYNKTTGLAIRYLPDGSTPRDTVEITDDGTTGTFEPNP